MVFSWHADAWSGMREKVLPCDLVVDGGDIGQVSNRSIGIKKKIHPRKGQSHLQSFESQHYVLWLQLLKYTRGKCLLPPHLLPLPQAPSALNVFFIWTRTFLVRTWSKSAVCRSLWTNFDVRLSNWTAWCGVEHLGLGDTWFFQPWGLRGGRFQSQPSETWLRQLWRVSQDSVRCDKTKYTAKTPRPFPK